MKNQCVGRTGFLRYLESDTVSLVVLRLVQDFLLRRSLEAHSPREGGFPCTLHARFFNGKRAFLFLGSFSYDFSGFSDSFVPTAHEAFPFVVEQTRNNSTPLF